MVHEVIDTRATQLRHVFFNTKEEAERYINRYLPAVRHKFSYIHREWGITEISKCWVVDYRHTPEDQVPSNL